MLMHGENAALWRDNNASSKRCCHVGRRRKIPHAATIIVLHALANIGPSSAFLTPRLKCAGSLWTPSSARPSLRNGPLASAPASYAPVVGTRMPINEDYPGLERVHSNPDVFLIKRFLDDASCNDLVDGAKEKGTSLSPVAYAGWTDDIKELLGLAASGPVSWFAILGAWYEAQGDAEASIPSLVLNALRNYAVLFAVALAGIAAFTKFRADSLQSLRTSSSTTLDDLSRSGPREFVRCASALFAPASASSTAGPAGLPAASFFEAPTVIRYEKDQALAPHYDANRSADVEDANRGGQTLSTLIVYLNDVERGGTTRFGKLPAADHELQARGESNLTIVPRKGDAILFFPADGDGTFDEMTEHEGRPAVDEKWIARIWRHADRVPPPFGLSSEAIDAHV